MTGPTSVNLCRDCGQDHTSGGEALDCTERLAEACRCGHCTSCLVARWWQLHPGYVEWQNQKTTRRS